ncbi:MAG: hypothetical protein ACRCYQ_07290 [Nocardioides sp.]
MSDSAMPAAVAFEDFLAASWPRVYKSVFFVAGDDRRARAVAIEGLASVAGRRRGLEFAEPGVLRAALRHAAAASGQPGTAAPFLPDDASGSDEIERDRATWAAASRLTGPQRAALLLRVRDELDAEEIADYLGRRARLVVADLASAEQRMRSEAVDDVDERVRWLLRRVAEWEPRELPAPELREIGDRALAAARRRRRTGTRSLLLAAGAAALLVAAIAVPAVRAGRDPGTPGPVSPETSAREHAGRDAGRSAVGRWEELPPAPLSPRWQSAITWTGSEVIVLGGVSGDCVSGTCPESRDGAAYDPDTGRWRAIADAPVGVSTDWSALQVGASWVISRDQEWWAYDVGRDSWREVDALPSGSTPYSVAATDQTLYAVDAAPGAPIHALDVARGTWSRLPADPNRPLLERRALVTTDAGLVVIGGDARAAPGNPLVVGAVHAALYADGTWSRFPESSQSALACCWTSAGERVVHLERMPIVSADSVRFAGGISLETARRPWTRAWRYLEEQPNDDGGNRVLRVSAATERFAAADGLVYDQVQGRWSILPRPAQAPVNGVASVWAGERLFAFGGLTGGTDGESTGINRAWLYTPAGVESHGFGGSWGRGQVPD